MTALGAEVILADQLPGSVQGQVSGGNYAGVALYLRTFSAFHCSKQMLERR